MSKNPFQLEADRKFIAAIEEAKAAGCRSWWEIGQRLGYGDTAGLLARRRRAEKNLNVLVKGPTGRDAPNAKKHVSKPIDVVLRDTGQVVEGLKLKGTSTYYDKEGQPAGQWIKTDRDQERLELYYKALGAALREKVPRYTPVKLDRATRRGMLPHLMAGYPIGDAHIGMLSWKEETGEAWDLAIAQQIQTRAMSMLVDSAPMAETATIVNLGDWFHYDSMAAITPGSGHNVDSDSRYGKVIRVGIAVMRTCIEHALRKHHQVRVVCAIGNHDETGALWLANALAGTYERERRVTIDTSPSVFNYFEFGSNLVGIHHGHKTPPKRLPGVMAEGMPEAWGRTKHRYWWLGHVHHQRVLEEGGVRMEWFNTLAAKDAYGHSGGWRARRMMNCLVLDATDGEVGRSTVTAAMAERAHDRRARKSA